jgi:hypothetical protein
MIASQSSQVAFQYRKFPSRREVSMSGSSVFIGLIVACLWGVLSQDDDSQASQVKQLAQRLATATLEGKFEQVVDLTYPPFVEVGGGREQTIAAIQKGISQMQDSGFKMEELRVGQPGQRYSSGEHQFIVVPTESRFTTPQGKVKAKSYLLAISNDAGKTWNFVDGAGLRRKVNRDRLPKLPEGFELPPFSQPELLPDKD